MDRERRSIRSRIRLAIGALALLAVSGCASMRYKAPDPLHRPCSEAFAITGDGWRIGMRHIRPIRRDPTKLPVVLCHGLGLNGTFWTITENSMASQLASRGYDVYIPDMRGSGASQRLGKIGRINDALRQTPFNEIGEGNWTVDDQYRYDVPAILDFIKADCGSERVNWVGHSLGGMIVFPYLETSARPDRIANFVAMGATIALADAPEKDMLRANRALRVLLHVASPGRLGRPLETVRPKVLERIDGFYYTVENVDRTTVDRFYGYCLENPGRGALKQLDPYLEFGHMLSNDRSLDYVALLPKVRTPILMVAGDGDVMSSLASTKITFDGLSSPDKSLMRFGKSEGHYADYGHCDLVWSRYAPVEVFPPIIDWLDRRQPGAVSAWPVLPAPLASGQDRVDAEPRPGLELAPQGGKLAQGEESGVGQAVLPR